MLACKQALALCTVLAAFLSVSVGKVQSQWTQVVHSKVAPAWAESEIRALTGLGYVYSVYSVTSLILGSI